MDPALTLPHLATRTTMSKRSEDNLDIVDNSQDIDQEYGESRVKADSLANVPDELEYSPPRPWWMLGFEKRFNLGLFIFFGGAMVGYSLAKSPSMSFKQSLRQLFPGEGFWFEQNFWKINLMIHVFASLPASFFSVFCFLPVTWKRWPKLHSVLGYTVSVLLVLSCVCGGIIGRRGQGGDLNTQSAFYMLASGAAGSVILGCAAARRGEFDAHREWMIRAWFYNGALVTTKITALLSAQVITAINTYHSLWMCSEIGYVLKSANALTQAFPQCATSRVLSNPNNVYVAVHASWKEGELGQGSAIRASYGMALWIAMIMHEVGIEIYLRMTLSESKKLRELSERRANKSEQTELQILRKLTR
ncbi:transmembrane protein, putative [Rhizoctonia solani AG-3 Rhs1AP]|uniref:Transmembrane protein, putative n=1 Tax=Rhizoctonia solani AG-3 Rhs1AP TaxID=1086054 RepID=X8J3M9_9AGAM|nr:transmembrane protein, putative [Rhizoctonia solani AG-3 Rhs1AP]